LARDTQKDLKPKDRAVPTGLFREKALARFASPEQLDQLLRISSPAGRLALAAAAALFACALAWGVFGSLPTKVTGQGILLRSSGLFTVTAQNSGKIANLYCFKGGNVALGQTLAQITQPILQDKIESAQSALSGLREKFRLAKEFGTEDTNLRLGDIVKKKQHLEVDLRNLRAQLSWYGERIRVMSPFVDDGLISKVELFQYQTELAKVQENLSQKENEFNGFELQILELKNEIGQQLLDLKNQIVAAENDLLTATANLEMNAVVTSPYSGRVIELGVNIGSVVAPGAAIATLEIAGAEIAFLQAVLYLSPDQGQRVKEGMVVQLVPDTVKQERYGAMLGLVTKVSAFPASQSEMERTLQNPELVRQLAAKGVKVEVRCVIVPDADTASGYKWSSSSGPPFAIEPGTLCSAQIIVERQRPISLVIPLFNKYVLGQGTRPAWP
jgi:HlyD family secretion protein